MKKKNIVFVLYMLILALPLTELALRIAGYRAFNNEPFSISSKPSNAMVADSILGLKLAEGSFDVTINDSLNYEVTHFQESGRIVLERPDLDSLPKISIFGCSFTYGMGVNNNEVMSSVLQRKMKQSRIFNHAVPGYGNVQGLIQLEEMIKSGHKPDIAVFNFANFHHERNVLAPEYRQSLMLGYQNSSENLKMVMSKSRFPYVRLVNDELEVAYESWDSLYFNWTGRETFALVNFFQTRANHSRSRELKSKECSLKLFQNIRALCDLHQIKMVVFGITSNDETTVFLNNLKGAGINAIDIGLDLNLKKYNHQPYDSHPNQLAHSIFGDRMYKELIKLVAKKEVD